MLVSGADLTDAQPSFDQQTSQPVVTFRFNSSGARKFAEVDLGKCRQAVRHCAGQQGDFRAGHPNADHRRLRADHRQFHRAVGQRSCGPAARRRAAGAAHDCRGTHGGAGLGQDSINAGERAAYVGAALVIVFMLATYGLFGLFANIAVAINVAMIFGVLSFSRRDADAARHRRHRADGRHRGGFQRADL